MICFIRKYPSVGFGCGCDVMKLTDCGNCRMHELVDDQEFRDRTVKEVMEVLDKVPGLDTKGVIAWE